MIASERNLELELLEQKAMFDKELIKMQEERARMAVIQTEYERIKRSQGVGKQSSFR